jgi:hypothetical protein
MEIYRQALSISLEYETKKRACRKRYVELGGGKDTKDVCELRIHLTIEGKRVEVPVVVIQGDVKMGEGNSPKPTDDMNRYFTAQVRKGQLYQVIWKDPKSGEQKRKQVTTPKDKGWLVVELAGK